MHVLHVALEFTQKVGGLGAVTMGLLPALRIKGVRISIVTPFFDIYEASYSPESIQKIADVKHIYKGKIQTSLVYRVMLNVEGGNVIEHYLIKPHPKSFNNSIFDIEDPVKMYQAFPHSHPNNRREYFNGAVASLIRTKQANIPSFDIVHLHTWHVALTGCLTKEFENLAEMNNLKVHPQDELRDTPRIVFTTHMLLEREHGYIRDPKTIRSLFGSLGLPVNFEHTFINMQDHVRPDHLKFHALGLLYADYATIVSKSVVKEIFNGIAHGLLDVFSLLRDQDRFSGILNGIPYKEWDAFNQDNLGDFTLRPSSMSVDKLRIKRHLKEKFSQLDPNKPWFLFVGRFANEKGIDMLPAALDAIKKSGGVLIVMGIHISIDRNNPVSRVIEQLSQDPEVLIIDDPMVQKEVGKLVRAASAFTLIPSNNETCGLVPMEQEANASIPIASKIQGLPDSVIPLSADNISGTGFLFDYAEESRHANLQEAIIKAAKLYKQWQVENTLDRFLARLVINAKRFDWNADASDEYIHTYSKVLNMRAKQVSDIRQKSTMSRLKLNQFLQSPSRIFQIGFNKCGSTSIADLLHANGMPTVHYGLGALASKIYSNYLKNKPLLTDQDKHIGAYFDMENIYDSRGPVYAIFLFKKLDAQYPGSKFILNTRDKQNWIKSRCKHFDVSNGKTYVEMLCAAYKITREELLERWSNEWDAHHQAVLEHFKDRPQDLLVFDIEKDEPVKICKFFKENLGLELDPVYFKHLNKSTTLYTAAKAPALTS